MGRSITGGETLLIRNRALSYSFFAAWIAATTLLILGMCGVRFLRRSKPNHHPSPDESAKKGTTETTDPTTVKDNNFTALPCNIEYSEDAVNNNAPRINETADNISRELPPPPGLRQLKESHSCNNISNDLESSSRKNNNIIKSSLSLRMPSMRIPSMSMLKRDDMGKVIGQPFKREDSLWTKTIILGEKCQVPEDVDDDNAVIYDHKGKRVTAYHPKNQRSLHVTSRSEFCIDPDELIDHEMK